MEVIKRGAEAEIRSGTWLGREVIIKSRVVKSYRLQEIDSRLRTYRTKNEARLIRNARRCGVPTPIIYDIDLEEAEIVMQHIKGRRVKDALSGEGEETSSICREIGRLAALLHRNDIVHGDLTTSNMILYDGTIWMIDFSLGGKMATIEDKGVDLHLLREAFDSAHSDIFHHFKKVIDSYLVHYDSGAEVVDKVQEIENRGRYT